MPLSIAMNVWVIAGEAAKAAIQNLLFYRYLAGARA